MAKREVLSGPITPVSETYDVIYTNTVTIGVNAVQLYAPSPDRLEVRTTLVQADPDNAGNVFVGNAAGQYIQLAAGDSITIAVDPSRIYVRASVADQVVNWMSLA